MVTITITITITITTIQPFSERLSLFFKAGIASRRCARAPDAKYPPDLSHTQSWYR